jgi:hypothetical protein
LYFTGLFYCFELEIKFTQSKVNQSLHLLGLIIDNQLT